MKTARIAALCLILATPLAAEDVKATGFTLKSYGNEDCSGTPTKTYKSGTCRILSGNNTMKYGDFEDGCKKGGTLKYESFSELKCAGTGTAGKFKVAYEVDKCTKSESGGSSTLLTCGAFGTASVSALAIGAAILMSFL